MDYFKQLLRPNILSLKPYTCARDEFTGVADAYLDANENSLGPTVDGETPAFKQLHRYPDPLATEVKKLIAPLLGEGIQPENIFSGVGSDEAIDLLMRVACRPGVDQILTCPPTYGVYTVAAAINDVGIISVPLDDATFQPRVDAIRDAVDAAHAAGRPVKLIWLCAPNNPTGNDIPQATVEAIATLPLADGVVRPLVVVDEAYVHFARRASFSPLALRHPSVVIMQTFSKAYGLAAARFGIAVADAHLIKFLNAAKGSYNVPSLSAEVVTAALRDPARLERAVAQLIELREGLVPRLRAVKGVQRVLPSDANFVLVTFDEEIDAQALYKVRRGGCGVVGPAVQAMALAAAVAIIHLSCHPTTRHAIVCCVARAILRPIPSHAIPSSHAMPSHPMPCHRFLPLRSPGYPPCRCVALREKHLGDSMRHHPSITTHPYPSIHPHPPNGTPGRTPCDTTHAMHTHPSFNGTPGRLLVTTALHPSIPIHPSTEHLGPPTTLGGSM